MAIQDIVGVSIIGAIVGVFALMIFIARKDQAAWLAARPERDREDQIMAQRAAVRAMISARKERVRRRAGKRKF